MAILSNQGDPILIISMDLIEVTDSDIADVISISKPDVTDKEIEEKKDIIQRLLTSDSWNKQIRIPILITDALSVQMVGSNSSTGKTVNYVDNEPKVSNLNNSVSIELTLKNNVGDLSIIADILSAVFTRVFNRYTTSARASFFGHNICIFNGYLTGVNRQTVANTDKERLNLTFERANDNPSTDELDEQPTVPDAVGGKTSTPSPLPPFEIPNTVTPPSLNGIGIQSNHANPSAGGAVGDRVFLWYNVGGLPQTLDSIVPLIFNTVTVNRLGFKILVAQSNDFSGTLRQAITIVYDDVNMPLGLNSHFPYFKPRKNKPLGYAITTQNGWLYIGVEVNAS